MQLINRKSITGIGLAAVAALAVVGIIAFSPQQSTEAHSPPPVVKHHGPAVDCNLANTWEHQTDHTHDIGTTRPTHCHMGDDPRTSVEAPIIVPDAVENTVPEPIAPTVMPEPVTTVQSVTPAHTASVSKTIEVVNTCTVMELNFDQYMTAAGQVSIDEDTDAVNDHRSKQDYLTMKVCYSGSISATGSVTLTVSD